MLHDELELHLEGNRARPSFYHWQRPGSRAAYRSAIAVLLMSFRPGRIKSQFQIKLDRPRHVEDSDVAYLSQEILGQLREEIDRSFNAEYSREEKH